MLSPLLIGYALDPSVDSNQISSNSFIGAVDEAEKNKGNTFLHDVFLGKSKSYTLDVLLQG